MFEFAVSIFYIAIVFKVANELVPRDELFVIDTVDQVWIVHLFVHLVFLDFNQNLVEVQKAAFADPDRININEVWNSWIRPQVHHEVLSLQDFLTVYV